MHYLCEIFVCTTFLLFTYCEGGFVLKVREIGELSIKILCNIGFCLQ
jgi:hypothetical protein